MFIDANYFLRYFLGDNLAQQKKVIDLFENSKKEQASLYTNHIVLFEVNWVLSTFYRKTKDEVILALKTILLFKFIRIDNKEIISEAIRLFEKHSISLEDSYHIAYTSQNQISEIGTFDKKLQRIFKEVNNK